MPETIQVEYTIYNFDELSDDAKQKALEDFCSQDLYPCHAANLKSLKAFCDLFTIKIQDYSIGGNCERNYIRTNADNDAFRNLRLNSFDLNTMVTGYYVDSVPMEAFRERWMQTGSAFIAFRFALQKFLNHVADDIDNYFSMESLKEMSEANEWKYTANGEFFSH